MFHIAKNQAYNDIEADIYSLEIIVLVRMLILFTAFSVSIDAYVAGLAYSLNEKTTIKPALCVLLYTFLLCVVALFIGGILSRYGVFFKILGCVLFVFLGVKNIIAFYVKKTLGKSENPMLIGIGVGLDASVACLSFSFSSLFAIAVALIMAILHSAFFILGQCSAKFLKTAEKMSLASGILLVLLGIYKLF